MLFYVAICAKKIVLYFLHIMQYSYLLKKIFLTGRIPAVDVSYFFRFGRIDVSISYRTPYLVSVSMLHRSVSVV